MPRMSKLASSDASAALELPSNALRFADETKSSRQLYDYGFNVRSCARDRTMDASNTVHRGTVKFFDAPKGYGFIYLAGD